MKRGDYVKVAPYGKERTAIVNAVRNDIVWVTYPDTNQVRWFHKESVTPIK